MVEHFASWIHHSNKLVITILFYFLSKIFIFIENIVPSNKILTTQIKSVWIRIVEIFKLARKDFSHFKLRNLSRKKKLDCIRIETVWFGFKHENEIRTASKTKLTNRTTETLTLNLVHLHRHGCYPAKIWYSKLLSLLNLLYSFIHIKLFFVGQAQMFIDLLADLPWKGYDIMTLFWNWGEYSTEKSNSCNRSEFLWKL